MAHGFKPRAMRNMHKPNALLFLIELRAFIIKKDYK